MAVSWNTVESSNINMVGYDKDTQELHVKFSSGSEYVYSNVPEDVFNEFKDASSVGRYLNEHIKNVYGYRKVG